MYSNIDTSSTSLATYASQELNLVNEENKLASLTVLTKGKDALVARIALARAAEKTLDLQYYHFHNDLSGKLLFYELWQAANRGVRVRLLLDDMNLEAEDEILAKLNAHPNLFIRLFNPFARGKLKNLQYMSDFSRINRRMHNKSFIADNQMAILGGRNIGDRYFGASSSTVFGDLDIVITGNPVKEISKSFDTYWNSEHVYTVESLVDNTSPETIEEITRNFHDVYQGLIQNDFPISLVETDLAQAIRSDTVVKTLANVEIYYDTPSKLNTEDGPNQAFLIKQLETFFSEIKNELIIVSPYFIPGDKGMAYFEMLADKGVDVTIITNSLASQDVPIVYSAYAKYRKALLNLGITLYELDSRAIEELTSNTESEIEYQAKRVSLHAKYFLGDGDELFIGSMNLDPRSAYINTEIGALVESEELTTKLRASLLSYIDDIAYMVILDDGDIAWQKKQLNKLITLDKAPDTSWWQRFSNKLMGFLPVESQL